MGVTAAKADPLAGGFYSVRDAARLLQIDSRQRIRGWLTGYPGRAGPMIARDYEPVDGTHSLSFLDLMEVRFLEHFRKQGVPLQTLRRAVVRARAEMQRPHPFALRPSMRFITDRRKIFGQVAEEAGDTATWDLVTNQYVMYAAIEKAVAEGVAFDPVTGLAESWHPLQNEFPNVIVHPHFAFGRPVVGERGVPTSALFRLWKAEKGNEQRVAKWFGVTPVEVTEAVGFEERLAAA